MHPVFEHYIICETILAPAQNANTLLQDYSNISAIPLCVHWTTAKSDMRSSRLYIVLYDTPSFSLFCFLLPLTLLVYFNVGILKALLNSLQFCNSFQNHVRQQNCANQKTTSINSDIANKKAADDENNFSLCKP